MSEPLFWTCDDSPETLSHTEMYDAIEEHLDEFWPALYEYKDRPAERLAAFVAGLPPVVEVYGYSRVETPRNIDVDDMLEQVMRQYEESNVEVADAFGDTTWDDRVTPEALARVKAAAQKFIDTLLDEYVPWGCEQTQVEKLNTMAWIKENRPEWLEAEPAGIGGWGEGRGACEADAVHTEGDLGRPSPEPPKGHAARLPE